MVNAAATSSARFRNARPEGVLESYRHGSDAHSAVEILLKGPEERLPPGTHFFDKDGHGRGEVRLRWWDQNAITFRKAALGMEGKQNEIPDSRLPTDCRYHESKPVFFGHYWLNGSPELTAPNAACLDFSVAKKGYLTRACPQLSQMMAAAKWMAARKFLAVLS
jgi:hypothetical protein